MIVKLEQGTCPHCGAHASEESAGVGAWSCGYPLTDCCVVDFEDPNVDVDTLDLVDLYQRRPRGWEAI